jgi:phosphatidylserine/phosphatidylglycerophosphate/cardiolipin synthase-like enzyme
MHAKFILLDGEAASRSAYGSLNLNARSRKVNREIFVLDESPEVFAALDQRWQSIERECRRQAERPKGDGLGSPQT